MILRGIQNLTLHTSQAMSSSMKASDGSLASPWLGYLPLKKIQGGAFSPSSIQMDTDNHGLR